MSLLLPLDLRPRTLVAFAALGLWWGSWGALLPAVQRSAGVDDGQLGTAVLFVGVGALVSMRFTGSLLDRVGPVVLPVTVALFAVAGVGPGLAEGTVGLAAALLVVGVTSGAMDVAINAEGSRAEIVTGRPLLNLSHAWFSIGVIIGSLGAGLLRSTGAGLVTVLVIVGAVVAGMGACLGTGEVDGDGSTEQPPARVTPGPWWRPPRYLAVLGVLLGLAFLAENAWQTWAAVHLERDLGASEGRAALGPALFGASAAAGRLLAHRWSSVGERNVAVAGALVATGGTLLGAAAPSTALVLIGIALAGLGTGVCAPVLFGLAGRSVPAPSRGAAVGTVTTIGYLGFVLAPVFIGQLAGATTLPWALAAVAVVSLGLAVGIFRLR